MKCQELLVQSNYLKSGRVNFILPCSVAIFSARGTASSHLERTHSLSHLEAQQPIRIRIRIKSAGSFTRKEEELISKPMSVSYLKRISELVEALRLWFLTQKAVGGSPPDRLLQVVQQSKALLIGNRGESIIWIHVLQAGDQVLLVTRFPVQLWEIS
ncbi:hypothetical protein GOODEAATRI_020388 [Goodea atripinnis]|uniref:Uncharacterized protein n=1 Tax=Goodea atripinnis TaxID=208336 RepID=A0ABV0P6F8_9TELE